MAVVLEKLSLVFVARRPSQDTVSAPDAVSERTFITPAIRPNIRTVSMHLVIQEVPFIHVFVGRDETTFTRASVFQEVAGIGASVRPSKSPRTVLLIVLKGTSIDTPVSPGV